MPEHDLIGCASDLSETIFEVATLVLQPGNAGRMDQVWFLFWNPRA